MSARIFISYRREDTSLYAQSLKLELSHHFEEGDVFLDRTGIEPGDSWPKEIEEAIDSAEVVLVLIGKNWLTVSGKNGRRRLDDPDDTLRKEVIIAIERAEHGVTLIPVLINGATMPEGDDLPEPLARLATRQGISIRDRWFIRETKDLVQTLIRILNPDLTKSTEEELNELRKRIRFRRLALASAAGFAVVIFFAMWVGLIAHRSADLYTITLGDRHAEKSFSDQIALITMDRTTEDAFGKPFKGNKSFWRGKHAALIDQLSTAGAEVIAFDLYFDETEETEVADREFAEAARRAAANGSTVLVGARSFTKERPPIPPTFRDGVGGWGSVGVKLHNGFAYAITLATLKRSEEALKLEDPTGSTTKDAKGGGVVIPALSLRCLAAFHDHDQDLDPEFRLNPLALSNQVSVVFSGSHHPITFSCFDIVPYSRRNAGKVSMHEEGDAYAEMALDLSPIDQIRNQTAKYEDVLALPDDALTGKYEGKIVLVGDTEEDHFDVRWRTSSEARWGVELHADALSGMLGGRSIHSPPGRLKLLLTVGLFVLGAFARTMLVGRKWYWHWAVLIGLLITYYQVSMFCYAEYRYLLSLLDGSLAFLLSFLLVGKLRRSFL